MPLQVLNECDSTSQIVLTTAIGIGRQTAIALSNAGWNVVLTARRLSALLETSELLRDPSACLTVAGDISDEEFVKELFSSAIAEFGECGITRWDLGDAYVVISRTLGSFIQCKYDP